IHGAYWHQSFGIPVSHGCVNLQPGDAAWLWEWSAIGTPVIVQP
ncbi:MAG: L,D-transpeptidase, partial [Anaerolineae bacterium]